MNERRFRRRCVQCRIVFDVWREGDGYYDGRTCKGKNTVVWQACPFQEEIHGDATPMWLCADCAYNNYMDT